MLIKKTKKSIIKNFFTNKKIKITKKITKKFLIKTLTIFERNKENNSKNFTYLFKTKEEN